MSTLNKEIVLHQLGYSASNKKEIIANVDVTLSPQKIYTVIGPSGTGKTTLLKLIAGLLEPTAGSITKDGQIFVPKEHVIGLVPQNYGLLPWQTAWQAVSEHVKISQKKRKLSKEDETRIKKLFEEMKLQEVMFSYPSQMSGGQQQRVALTRTFAIDADIVLMDEPFSALDAFTREKTQSLFLSNWRNHPCTTFFITHDIEEALLIGHECIVMGGKPGTIQRIIQNPLGSIEEDIQKRRQDVRFYEVVQKLRKEIEQHEG